MVRFLPLAVRLAMRRHGAHPTRYVLRVSVLHQRMDLFERMKGSFLYARPKRYRISTSAFGIGQRENSNQTPLGLHCIARKIGGGMAPGTVFRGRVPVGLTWQGMPHATIVHRILWLEGLEPGVNRGGNVDSFRRYIYIHGFADELTLGHPASHGCIHMAGHDLLPLFDKVAEGTLVHISA